MTAGDAVRGEAAVFWGDRRVRTEQVVVPPPVPGQIRVRLEGCGVCASNVPVWEGRPWFQYPVSPGAPGHEGWGVVDAVGEAVRDFSVGDRVAFLSTNAYAQYDLTASDEAVPIPDSLSGQAVPGEPLACALNIFRRSDIQSGQTVAIVGIGFLGAMLTHLCEKTGARVIALSRRAFSREVAERFGARATLDLDDTERSVKQARSFTQDAGFERVIEAVGSQEALDVATALAGTRARVVIAGYHQDGSRTVDLQRWNWLGLDVISAHERDPAIYRRGMRDAIAMMASGAIDPAPLLTHRFPLAEIGDAFNALAERPRGFVKAVVTCS
jgi:threonine dehydrogenase-like Zn-dependent dehydrogenase